MWVFLNNAFLSIVAPQPGEVDETHELLEDLLVVRARAEGDIERVFSNVEVQKSKQDRDYAFRAFVMRSHVAAVMAKQVQEIRAPNFKDSVTEGDRQLAYQRVWAVMLDFQTDRGNPGKYGRPLAEDLIGDPAYEEYLRPGRRPTRRPRK